MVDNQTAAQTPHIMISYNWTDSKAMALKMCKQLQGHGFHVWLDDGDIKGNIYAAMAAAVNNAFLILMFVSSNYETSINCQKEACFAISEKKWIIPIYAQEGYRAKNWLGLIIAGLLYHDFSKGDYEANFKKLLKEIESSQNTPRPHYGQVVHTHERGKADDPWKLQGPISPFLPTKTYKKLSRLAESSSIFVLHCYGQPGNGKSEIIRKLAADFPFVKSETQHPCVKWHLQYFKSKTSIKQELQKLVKKLHARGLLISVTEFEEIMASLEKEEARPLASFLCKANIDLVILFEDFNIDVEAKKYVYDFVSTLSSSEMGGKTHIYLTTEQGLPTISLDQYSHKSYYNLVKIKGFQEHEGMMFLLDGADGIRDVEAAKQVNEQLDGSPLALQFAKSYCRIASLHYYEYLTKIEENIPSTDSNPKQKIFAAITLLPDTPDKKFNKWNVTWKVFCCLSLLTCESMPEDFVLECFRYFAKQDEATELASKKIRSEWIDDLKSKGMCTRSGKKSVSFHQLIMMSFQSYRESNLPTGPIYVKHLMYILAGLVTKDFRSDRNLATMTELQIIGKEVLKLAENNKEEILGGGENGQVIFRLILSRLYEVFGALVSFRSPIDYDISLELLEKSLELLLPEENWNLIQRKPARDANGAADKIIDCCQINFPSDLITEYEAMLHICLGPQEFAYLKQQSKKPSAVEKIEKDEKETLENLKLINLLRSAGVFLKEDDQKKIFLAEKVSTILHSLSRVVLYKGTSPSTKELEDSKWRSSLSHAIAKRCRENYNIGLLVEHLSITAAMIPLLLKSKDDDNALQEAKKMCELALDKNSKLFDMYEHGLLKEVYGPSHNSARLQMLKNLLRTHSRLARFEDGNKTKEERFAESHETCEELLELAQRKLDDKLDPQCSGALASFIYCAKYYAAFEDYESAMKCFVNFFENQYFYRLQPAIQAWGAYNFARAVVEGKLSNEVKKAKEMCESFLLSTSTYIAHNLKEKLRNILKDLRRMDSVSPPPRKASRCA
ncbi:unnamed protein product [Clavelina lepadiformis]|uniref:TIR domain-containing protein n=1 Tax=Clavelina lepadiformis TaxID=159417 RepID=A0ABP0GN14_CLALP